MSFSLKTSLWSASKTSKVQYSPRFTKKDLHSRKVAQTPTHVNPIKETFFVDASRRDAFKRSTLNLRRWLATILLYHLLGSGGRHQPSGLSTSESQTLEALSDNISHFLWHGHNDIETVDQTAFVAVYYASYLVPNGILDHRELYSADGVLVATRLFMVSYALAIKCFNDSYKPTMYKECHRLKANLPSSSALLLEFSALEALGFDIFLQHGIWVKHLETILEWTVMCSTGIHLSVKNQITQLLDDAISSLATEQTTSKPPSMPPSTQCLAKVRDQLLSGLSFSEENY